MSETNKCRNNFFTAATKKVALRIHSSYEIGAENIDISDNSTCYRKWTVYTKLLLG